MAVQIDSGTGPSDPNDRAQGDRPSLREQKNVNSIHSIRPEPRAGETGDISNSTSTAPTEAVENLQISPLISFFTIVGKGPDGLTHSDILRKTDEELEHSHNYVQWLFPLPEPSLYNANAPLIQEKELVHLRSPFAVTHHVAGVMRFLKFYGMEYKVVNSTIHVFPSADFDARSVVWATPNNHNLKRITRIIRSCRYFGNDNIARGIFDAFRLLADRFPEVINETVLGYWNDCWLPLNQNINVPSYVKRVK